MRFTTYDELRAAAVPLGFKLNLEPINRVYFRYRFTWFDVLAGILSLGPPLLGMGLLGSWILKLRRRPTVKFEA